MTTAQPYLTIGIALLAVAVSIAIWWVALMFLALRDRYRRRERLDESQPEPQMTMFD
jgi:hypothetical protein